MNTLQTCPNWLSSDLYHPGWVKQQNVFTAGLTSRKANCWGNDSSKYGGTGKLPALKTSQDIDSRSHRHYGSGIHSVDVPSQDCVITTISPIVDHTISDELCSIKKQLLPDHLIPNPYANHISRFEVFPRFDPGRTGHDVPTERTLEQDIGQATQIALEELSNSIYRETEYQRNYKPPPIQVENTCMTTLPEIGHFVQLNEEKEKEKEEQDLNEIKEQQEPEEEDEEEGKDEEGTDEESNIKPGSDSNSTETNKEAILTNAGQTIPVIDTKSAPENSPVPKAFNSDALTKKAMPALCRLEKLSVSHPPSLPPDFRARHKLSLPKVTDYGKKKTFDPPKLITFPTRMPATFSRGLYGDVRLPSIGFIHSDLTKQLSFIKPRLPEMVGIKFKSNAHVKYHRIHPESIPDLRQSITDGKQHFFYGVHASLLR